tara:strand:+ start:901 stop:1110 length:210 start_codon:yes stop_codon:yes gene_type:complete
MSDEHLDTHEADKTFENEQSTVTLTIKEYDKLREKQKYITDRDMISVIDKIEELVRALRKHIVRSDFND